MENTARKFQFEESYKTIKKDLSVEFLNPVTLSTVSEKAFTQIEQWQKRKINATPEMVQQYNLEIAKLEALIQKMTDITLDIYEVQASAYLDTRGMEPVVTKVEEALVDIGQKADTGSGSEKETPVVDMTADAVVITDTDGKEVQTPTQKELTAAIKSLIKRGRFDSAKLMADKYLSVGNYIPKKEGKEAEKWSEERIASWIKDLNVALMDEKSDKKTTDKEVTATEAADLDVAKNGLTGVEVENLRLLEMVIPEAVAGHQDYQSRRDKLKKYLTLGATLNEEDEMLWAIAKRILGTQGKVKLPEVDLINLTSDIDKFCKIFFEHRPYTEKSVKEWRAAARKETGISNFKYLRIKDEIDPLKLPKSGINMVALDKRIAEEVLAGKTVQDVLATLEEGILYKAIEGKDNKDPYKVYTKLHAKDLIERMYSVHSTKANAKKDPDLKTTIKADKSKVDIAEVKLLLSEIANNGGNFDDVKSHPEIINLVDREIQDNSKSPALKFGNTDLLFPYLETKFKEIAAKVVVADVNKEIQANTEDKYADLDKMLTLCIFAAQNDVSQEDFIKEHKDLVTDEKGNYKSLMSENKSGGSKTVVINSKKDFETWVNSTYEANKKITKSADKKDPELVDSMKELLTKGNAMLDKKTPYETVLAWVSKNVLNRKLKEQKPEQIFKSSEAVASFVNNTFKEKLTQNVPKVVEKTTEVLTEENIKAIIAEDSKQPGSYIYGLIRKLAGLYKDNNIQVNGVVCSLKEAHKIVEKIVETSNPTMYAEYQKRRAEKEKQKKDQFSLPLEAEEDITPAMEPVEATENVEEVVDTEHQIFEKVDIASVDPELWGIIQKFTTLDEVYNMSVELNANGKFNEALSMCLVIMPTLKDSKDWNPEQITEWFNKMILKKETTTEPAAEEVVTESVVEETDALFKDLQESVSNKSMKRTIASILKAKEDNEELRKSILNSIKTGNGAHTRKVAKMPDAEIHNMLNNIKEKIGKFSKVE